MTTSDYDAVMGLDLPTQFCHQPGLSEKNIAALADLQVASSTPFTYCSKSKEEQHGVGSEPQDISTCLNTWDLRVGFTASASC